MSDEISDLFFMVDTGSAKLTGMNDEIKGFYRPHLVKIAAEFLQTLEPMTSWNLPTADQLADDYLSRV